MSKATLHPSWFHLRKSLRTLARGVAQPGGKHPAKHIEVDGSPEVPSIEGVNRMATRIESLHNPVNTSEERWKTALDGIGIGVWDWDISTNTVQYSKQCKDMLGYAANEIANRYEAWLDLIHPEDLPAALRKIQEHFLGRTTSYSAEFRMLGKQGTWTWILSRGIVTDRDAAGKPLRMVGTHTDITAHRQSMEELKRHKDHLEELVRERTAQLEKANRELSLARDAAEEANRTKSMFLANMSHEIRTPMNAVLGFAQLLQRDPSLSPESLERVSTILKSGDHLLSIINDILEMSRIEAGRVEAHPETLDLHTLLEELVAMIRQRAETKGLEFAVEIAPTLPHAISADVGKIRQVLINLLGNAVKFTPRGSVSLRAYPSGTDRVTIEVEDTGIGIAPADLEKLFHPFGRTLRGEQTAGGTGLGLAISHEHARLMGGSIRVASIEGKGSCFRFEFPAPPVTAPRRAPAAPGRVTGLSPGQGTIRVLVVDDLPLNRILLRELLQPVGFVIQEASSGEEAIDTAKTFSPRIILMDLVMPGMDGCEATRILRTIYPHGTVTIIGISASAFDADQNRFNKAGLDAFIAKPFNSQTLFATLARHAGIAFERKAPATVPPPSKPTDLPTLTLAPARWRAEFTHALAQASITQLRNLGQEAASFDPGLSAYLLERVQRYDVDGLKDLDKQDR